MTGPVSRPPELPDAEFTGKAASVRFSRLFVATPRGSGPRAAESAFIESFFCIVGDRILQVCIQPSGNDRVLRPVPYSN